MGKVVISYNDPHSLVKYQPATPKPVSLRADGSYLLIGGLGGLGRSLVNHMFNLGARSFVFLSRSGDSRPAARATVEHLRSLGAQVSVITGTAASPEDVQRAISSAPSPIIGVFNFPLVLRDGLIEKMTVSDLSACRIPKLDATQVLHTALESHKLDFFITASSASGGVVGWPVQANYGAANTSVDAFTRHRRSLGLPAVSINFAVIQEVGYVAERDDQGAHLERWGMTYTDEAGFLHTMDIAMAQDQSISPGTPLDPNRAHIVMGFEPAALRDVFPKITPWWKSQARLAPVVVAAEKTAFTEAVAEAGGRKALRDAIKEAGEQSEQEARKVLSEALIVKFADILSMDRDAVDANRGLGFYGMDSMVAAELRTWLWKELRADVPLLEILSAGTTLKTLGERVWKEL